MQYFFNTNNYSLFFSFLLFYYSFFNHGLLISIFLGFILPVFHALTDQSTDHSHSHCGCVFGSGKPRTIRTTRASYLCVSTDSRRHTRPYGHSCRSSNTQKWIQWGFDGDKQREPTHQIHRMTLRSNRKLHVFRKLRVSDISHNHITFEVSREAVHDSVHLHIQHHLLAIMLDFQRYLETSEITISLVGMVEREHWLHIAQQRSSVDLHHVGGFERLGDEDRTHLSNLQNEPIKLQKENILENVGRHAAGHQARGIVWNKQASGQQKALSADKALRAQLVICKRAQQL